MQQSDALLLMMNGTGSLSDNSDTSDVGLGQGDGICRDYLRNVCKRGKRCRYRHPNSDEAKELVKRKEYTFCHDFQNSGCRRPNCRFIHCTREEEEYYKQTGQLPVRLQQAAALGIGVVPNEIPLLKGEIPVCKDFLKGECKRAGRCKYRHLSSVQYELEITRKNRTTYTPSTVESFTDSYKSDDFDRYTDYSETGSLKRRKVEDTNYFSSNHFDGYKSVTTTNDYTCRLFEEENAMLRRKVEELKKQVSDLAATNEVLLEQNARYRANKLNVNTPIVTVSQVVTPTITRAPVITRPPMPANAVTAMTSLRQVTMSIDAHNELLVSQPVTISQATLPPQLAAELAQQAIAPATPSNQPPVSVAMNPRQTIVPVSIALDTSVAPPVSMSQVSMAQNLPAMSLAQTSLPTQTLIGSRPSCTPLVSYPIMSHTVAQLPTSSLG